MNHAVSGKAVSLAFKTCEVFRMECCSVLVSYCNKLRILLLTVIETKQEAGEGVTGYSC